MTDPNRTKLLLTWRKIFLSLLVAGSFATLSACQTETPVSRSRVYLSLAPKDSVAANQARSFLFNAKDNISGNTQIIKSPHTYTVTETCLNNTPDFLVPSLSLMDGTSSETVTSEAEKSIIAILGDRKKCSASANSLIEISKNFSQAASSDREKNLIIFWQIPWTRVEISDDLIRKIKVEMDRLAKTGKIKKIVLFSIHPDGADRLSSCFSSFDKDIVYIASKQGELTTWMEKVGNNL
jgi:hypothetical protein